MGGNQRQSGFESWLCHSLIADLGSPLEASLRLSFLIYKMGAVLVAISRAAVRDQGEKGVSGLFHRPA